MKWLSRCRGLLLCLLLGSLASLAFAQEKPTELRVLDAGNGKPIASAVVTSYDASGKEIKYRLTNSSGMVFLPANSEAVKVKVRKMGYRDKELSLARIAERVELRLEEQAIELPEFIYQIPAMERKSDTLVYNATSFITPQDSYLRDLLSRLPGVRVNESGIVYYQGEPIKRFYIEGKDLLGSQYALATNNLSVDAISKVEVLDQFQDVKVLRGVVPESRSSMNVVLKESYKVRPFGTLEGGTGYEPLFYQAKGSATKVSKSPLQYYLYGSADNYDSKSKGGALGIDVSELNSLTPQRGKLSSSNLGNLLIPQKYHTYSKRYELSTNGLLQLSEESQLRLNINAYHDWTGQEEQQEEYYKELNYQIKEQTKRQNRRRGLKPILAYELNSKGAFLSNKLMADWGDRKGTRQVEGDRPALDYSDNSNYWWIQNNLETTISLNARRTLLAQFASRLMYGETKDRLWINQLSSELSQKEWQAKHTLGTSMNLPMEMLLSIVLNDHLYHRGYQMDGLETRLWHNEAELLPTLRIPFARKRGNVSVETAVRHTYQRIAGSGKGLLDASPTLSLSYKNPTGWYYLFSASLRRNMPLEGSYFIKPYRLSHRAESVDYLQSYEVCQLSLFSRLNYSNLIEYFFATLSLRYTDRRLPLVRDISVSQEGITTFTSLPYRCSARSLLGEMKVDKSFSEHGVNIIIDGLASLTSSPYSLNKLVAQGRYQNYIADLQLNYEPFGWLTLLSKVSYHHSLSKRDERSNWHHSSDLSGSLSALFALSDKVNVRGRYEWTYFGKEEGRELPPLHILSCSLDYIISKRVKILVEGNNLLNSNDYILRSQTPILEQTTLLQLRPRSMFVKVSWNY